MDFIRSKPEEIKNNEHHTESQFPSFGGVRGGEKSKFRQKVKI